MSRNSAIFSPEAHNPSELGDLGGGKGVDYSCACVIEFGDSTGCVNKRADFEICKILKYIIGRLNIKRWNENV